MLLTIVFESHVSKLQPAPSHPEKTVHRQDKRFPEIQFDTTVRRTFSL